MLEKVAYKSKYAELDSAAKLARDQIENFDLLTPIEKVSKVLYSFASHYIKNFASMSAYNRSSANAQMAAFIKKVAPELDVELEVDSGDTDQRFRFDLVVKDKDKVVAVETREPRPGDRYEALFDDEAAINQLSQRLYAASLTNGIVFFYPGRSEDTAIMTTASTAWPEDLKLREIYSGDPAQFDEENYEEPISLVDEKG
jgi:hypothetical protein